MLIDLSNYGPLTIDSSQYKKSLVITIEYPKDKAGCGVFAGNCDFPKEERSQLVSTLKRKDGELKFFLLNPPSGAAKNCVQRWYYAAVGWDNAVYVEYPYSYKIVLCEYGPNAYAKTKATWTVSVSGSRGSFTLILPGFKSTR